MLKIISHPDRSTGVSEELQATVETLSATFDELRSQLSLEGLESLEVVVADDVAAAVREVGSSTVGDEQTSDFHTDRVGGVVVGKTMSRDAECRRPVVVMARSAVDVSNPNAHARTVFLLAHEFAHIIIGQARRSAGGAWVPTWLPWEVTRWLARYAFEEYRADLVADDILGAMASITVETGELRPASMVDIAPASCEEFVEAATIALRRVVDRIHVYRQCGEDLSEMWLDVQTATGEILVALAHAQAACDRPGAIGQPVTSPTTGPLHDCWIALHRAFAENTQLGGDAEFATREAAVADEAGAAILAFWETIGLTFSKHPDSFHIHVAQPWDCWPDGDSCVKAAARTDA